MDPSSGRDAVPTKIKDRVCDQLARTVKSRLAASESFVEGRAAPRSFGGEIVALFGGDSADFAPAACVDWVELGGDNCRVRWGCGGGRVGFVGEEAGDKGVLQGRGVGVVSEAGEVEVPEDHRWWKV